LIAAASIAAAAVGSLQSRAQDEAEAKATELSAEARSALEGGLNFLDQEQGKDGSSGGVSTKGCVRLATTSVAGLAFLAAGNTPSKGPHHEKVRAAILYVLSQQEVSGLYPSYIRLGAHPGRDEAGRMHAHGLSVLFLAEAYGMLGEDKRLAGDVKTAIEGAIKVTLASQTRMKGGWGYGFAGFEGEPELDFDEASTTITQIQGLRAARNAGFSVPGKSIERAVKYVKECIGEKGDCCYSLSMADGRRTSFELTAAAVSTLNASGAYKTEKLELALGYMRRQMARKEKPTFAAENYYFYGNLYAAQAMFQAGGADWATWWTGAQEDLVSKAKRGRGDGIFWEDPRGFGDAYATASACLILGIPFRYLPIFER
jgi:hypothetical protein